MRTRRLFFIHGRQPLRLAPIFVALLSLASLGLGAFIVAFWPQDPAPAPYRQGSGDSAPENRPFEGGMRVPPDAREPGSRRSWM
jgi:hypothetical protein